MVAVVLGGKGLHKDGTGHVVVSNPDVLVSAVRSDGETSRVILVKSTERQFAQVDHWHWGDVSRHLLLFRLGMHGSNMLPGLGHDVAFDGGVG